MAFPGAVFSLVWLSNLLLVNGIWRLQGSIEKHFAGTLLHPSCGSQVEVLELIFSQPRLKVPYVTSKHTSELYSINWPENLWGSKHK